eukprot:12577000-Ditylum_brightwellii.AAC.1
MDPKYFKAVRNPVANQINQTIPQSFDRLFNTYGKNQLATLANITHKLILDEQKVDFGYLILQCTGKFTSSLNTWNALPVASCTWSAFQTHFCNA